MQHIRESPPASHAMRKSAWNEIIDGIGKGHIVQSKGHIDHNYANYKIPRFPKSRGKLLGLVRMCDTFFWWTVHRC